jgi:hypothetical protein
VVCQSQAFTGTLNFSDVMGCEAFAKPTRLPIRAPVAKAPIKASRLVILTSSVASNILTLQP